MPYAGNRLNQHYKHLGFVLFLPFLHVYAFFKIICQQAKRQPIMHHKHGFSMDVWNDLQTDNYHHHHLSVFWYIGSTTILCIDGGGGGGFYCFCHFNNDSL